MGVAVSENLFWLSETQMERLRPLLPDKVRGVPRVDDQQVISGIIHVLKSGCRWIDAPAEYGPRKTLYNRWRRWAEKGHWVRIFEALADAGGPPAQVLIDNSAVSAHRSASGRKGGRSRKGSVGRAAVGRPRSTRYGSLVPPRPADADGGQRRRPHRRRGVARAPAARRPRSHRPLSGHRYAMPYRAMACPYRVVRS